MCQAVLGTSSTALNKIKFLHCGAYILVGRNRQHVITYIHNIYQVILSAMKKIKHIEA